MEQRNTVHLAEAGPLDEVGFPRWYRDSDGTLLEIGLDLDDPNLPAIGELPTPGAPLSFPDNFPDEAFYFLAEARLPTGGTPVAGRARVILALEAAFGGDGKPKDRMQAVFGRIRFRIDGAEPNGTYVFTHPYGRSRELQADERGRLFETEDITLAPGDFDAALGSQIGPFLAWTNGAAPQGYLGDGTTPHRVTGSPFNWNFVMIERAGIGSLDVDGGPTRDPNDPTNADKVYTDLFTVQGREARATGVRIDRAAYRRPSAVGAPVTLDVLASTAPGKRLVLHRGPSDTTTEFRADGRSYLARARVTGAPRSPITVSNTTDDPPTVETTTPVDIVTATATYDIDTSTLTVTATSSDEVEVPTLEAVGHGALTVGQATAFAGVGAVPTTLRVISQHHGWADVPIEITGSPLPPVPVTAEAGDDQIVEEGLTVSLDGSGSEGDIDTWAWTQTAGAPAVVLAGADGANPSFTAPAAGSVVTLELTVDGPAGPSTDEVTITASAPNPPTADAGPDRTAVVGERVTLDGSASLGAETFAWVWIAGSPITDLTGADTPRPGFTMPASQAPVVLRLTVTGPGGPASTAQVRVTAQPDVLVVDRAQYRRGGRQWRVSGRANGPLPDQVTVSLGRHEIGRSPVDAAGTWDVRATVPPGANELVPANGAEVTVVSTRGGDTTGTVVIRS